MGIKVKVKVVPTVSLQVIVNTSEDGHCVQIDRLGPKKMKASLTIEDILKTFDIDYYVAYIFLNGAVLRQSDLHKSLVDLTYIDSSYKYILSVFNNQNQINTQ